MGEKIFSQRAVRHPAIALVLAISLVLIGTPPVAAISLEDYFEISYAFELSQTEVQGDEVFHATVTGEATCLETIVVPLSEAEITFRIVAEPQAGGGPVTLNPSYTLTIKPFPDTKSDTFEIDETIPLQFPSGSEPGNYDVVAELVEARVKWSLGWFDVTGYLPPSPAIGSVAYTASTNNPPDIPSTPSGRDWVGHSGIPYRYSTSATDPDGDRVKYTFDWGDGSTSETGFVDSGTIASESHTWECRPWEGETYYIRAKARDSKGASSGWSDSKTLSIVPFYRLNPDFEASTREGTAPLEVRFENWTLGGEQPYVRAEWDFDCDGVIETTLTGTDAEVMTDVTWTYPLPGLYTVCLRMTDSCPHPLGPLVHTEWKIWYITVLFEDPWAYDTNDNGTIEKSEAILAAQHYFNGRITKTQVIEVAMLYFG